MGQIWEREAELLSQCLQACRDTPASGLPLARTLWGSLSVQCLRTRAGAFYAATAGILGQPDAGRIIADVWSVGQRCPCCRPVVQRTRAVILARAGRHRDALRLADEAVAGAPTDPQGYLSRAYVYDEAGTPGPIVGNLVRAVNLTPPGPDRDSAVLCLCFHLGKRTDPLPADDVERLEGCADTLRGSFPPCAVRLDPPTVPKAHMVWLLGLLASHAGKNRPARYHLRRAVRAFVVLEKRHEAFRAWTDLAHLEAKVYAGCWVERLQGYSAKAFPSDAWRKAVRAAVREGPETLLQKIDRALAAGRGCVLV